MATLVLCLIVAAAVAAAIQRAGVKTPVIVVAKRVPESVVITRADLTTVAVAGGVTAIPAEELENVVGRRAASTLEAGALLQPSGLAPKTETDAGQANVGVAVAAGLAPDGLEPGDRVRVLQVPGKGSDTDSLSGPVTLAESALIVAVTQDSTGSGDLVVTVRVPAQSSGDVVLASSWGQVGLVQVGAGS
ncbi:hypothetical protein KIH74_35360 [Kineosporia sp. J2-2]|uniref:AFP-like domain-containing protein n=1 Tax=Kineosporia corallincola TaxID=2835133 RepID=A0ABS5TU03_9ACTN|nr:SAF domain-containing protein [Kineosporia corallincola]MBT0774276.1 hypothetical protein [Kineosporia corallincola]